MPNGTLCFWNCFINTTGYSQMLASFNDSQHPRHPFYSYPPTSRCHSWIRGYSRWLNLRFLMAVFNTFQSSLLSQTSATITCSLCQTTKRKDQNARNGKECPKKATSSGPGNIRPNHEINSKLYQIDESPAKNSAMPLRGESRSWNTLNGARPSKRKSRVLWLQMTQVLKWFTRHYKICIVFYGCKATTNHIHHISECLAFVVNIVAKASIANAKIAHKMKNEILNPPYMTYARGNFSFLS